MRREEVISVRRKEVMSVPRDAPYVCICIALSLEVKIQGCGKDSRHYQCTTKRKTLEAVANESTRPIWHTKEREH